MSNALILRELTAARARLADEFFAASTKCDSPPAWTVSRAAAIASVDEAIAALDDLIPRPRRSVRLRSFVAIGPGEWARGDSIEAALAAVRKRLGEPKRGRDPSALIIFASDAEEIDVWTGDGTVRCRVDEGNTLVELGTGGLA